MGWIDDELTRGRDELLRDVRRRGQQLRTRRRAVTALSVSAALMAVVLPGLLLIGRGDRDRTTLTATASSTRPHATAVPAASGETTASPPSPAITAPLVETTRPPRTTAPPRSVTSAPPSPPEPPPDTTPTTAPARSCASGEVAYDPLVTPKASYRPGEEVLVTAVLTNRAPESCIWQSSGSQFVVRDEAGRDVGGYGVAFTVGGPSTPIPPGEIGRSTWRWTASTVPGRYTLFVTSGEVTSPPITVEIAP